ncbi:MAG: hypothetical protein M3O01_14550, partial [Pseudomonadota bacterium]|nr:hypothetical protein [Pseudomonadota bacterium]
MAGIWIRWATVALLLGSSGLLGGCSPAGLLISAAGVATDTSMTWDIVKHVHAQLTEGDPTPCVRLDSAERALNPRCGTYVVGSLQANDVRGTRLQGCLLAVAVRDPRLWATLPDLLAKGAAADACAEPPLLELAQAAGCPDFAATSQSVRNAFRSLAEDDPRAVHHDVMRMLSCPSAVAAGLDAALTTWLARGALNLDTVSFGPLGALHPDHLGSPFARALEARGHTARAGLGGYDGQQPRGFELALRTANWAALEWWLARVPELANLVPASQGNQLAWRPLARVLMPKFLDRPERQADMVTFLMARGADPWRKLPYDGGSSIVQLARTLRSPMLALLDPAPP